MMNLWSQLSDTYKVFTIISIIVTLISGISITVLFVKTVNKYGHIEPFDSSFITMLIFSILYNALFLFMPVSEESQLYYNQIRTMIFSVIPVVAIQYLFYRVIYILTKNKSKRRNRL